MNTTTITKFTATHPVRFIGIFFAVTAIILTILGRYIAHELTYVPLEAVAQALPTYGSSQIVSGVRGERECYDGQEDMRCHALTLDVPQGGANTSTLEQFINSTAAQGIAWEPRTLNSSYAASKLFISDGGNYRLVVHQRVSGDASVALFLY